MRITYFYLILAQAMFGGRSVLVNSKGHIKIAVRYVHEGVGYLKLEEKNKFVSVVEEGSGITTVDVKVIK